MHSFIVLIFNIFLKARSPSCWMFVGGCWLCLPSLSDCHEMFSSQKEVSIEGSHGPLWSSPGAGCKYFMNCSITAEVLCALAPKMCNANRISILFFLVRTASLPDLLCFSPKGFGQLTGAREQPGGWGIKLWESFLRISFRCAHCWGLVKYSCLWISIQQ